MNCRLSGRLIFALSVATLSTVAAAEYPTFEIRIKDHRFEPNTLVVPANQKFRLKVVNEDNSFAEFESRSLIIEKFVGPKKTLNLVLGPLRPGTYDFFEEFHLATAQGKVEAK